MGYPISSSPLYELGSKRRLCSLLYIDASDVDRLMSDASYREWEAESGRLIEEPVKSLKLVQGRVKELLSRIEHPPWVHSGVRGRSYLGHAEHHSGQRYVCSMDIDSFFQSTRKEFVFRFFRYVLRQPEDVAWMMSDLVSYKNHLPTGSPSSQSLAFWSYRSMFESLCEAAMLVGGTLTLYVDDISVSSVAPLPEGLPSEFESIMNGYALQLKESKTSRKGSRKWKVITGVAISPEGDLRVPNRRRARIHEQVELLKNGKLDRNGLESLVGMLSSARQIEPTFHEAVYQYSRSLLRSS